MKKSIIAMVSMLVMAGSVNAAWDPGSSINGDGGELLLTVWDNKQSYVYDLGLRYADVASGLTGNRKFSLNGFQFSSDSEFKWSIVGASARLKTTVDDNYPMYKSVFDWSDAGAVVTSRLGRPSAKHASQAVSLVNNTLSPFAAALNGSDTDFARNGGSTQSASDTDYAGQPGWSNTLSRYTGTQGNVSMELWLLSMNANGIGNTPELRGWAWLDFSGNTPHLQLVSATPVPVPAAAWLFGSALLGLRLFRSQRING